MARIRGPQYFSTQGIGMSASETNPYKEVAQSTPRFVYTGTRGVSGRYSQQTRDGINILWTVNSGNAIASTYLSNPSAAIADAATSAGYTSKMYMTAVSCGEGSAGSRQPSVRSRSWGTYEYEHEPRAEWDPSQRGHDPVYISACGPAVLLAADYGPLQKQLCAYQANQNNPTGIMKLPIMAGTRRSSGVASPLSSRGM